MGLRSGSGRSQKTVWCPPSLSAGPAQRKGQSSWRVTWIQSSFLSFQHFLSLFVKKPLASHLFCKYLLIVYQYISGMHTSMQESQLWRIVVLGDWSRAWSLDEPSACSVHFHPWYFVKGRFGDCLKTQSNHRHQWLVCFTSSLTCEHRSVFRPAGGSKPSRRKEPQRIQPVCFLSSWLSDTICFPKYRLWSSLKNYTQEKDNCKVRWGWKLWFKQVYAGLLKTFNHGTKERI